MPCDTNKKIGLVSKCGPLRKIVPNKFVCPVYGVVCQHQTGPYAKHTEIVAQTSNLFVETNGVCEQMISYAEHT